MLAAAGEAPAAADAIAAFDRSDLGHRHVGGGDQRADVLAPNVLLGLDRIARQLPRVHAHHAVDPCGGHAALGEGHLDLEEGAWIDLVAAPLLRLQGAEQAGLLHLADGLVRHLALAVGLLGTFAQGRNQATGTIDQLDLFPGFLSHDLHR
ncbi:hypothetical protein D3C78_1264910 [compost metagenome]